MAYMLVGVAVAALFAIVMVLFDGPSAASEQKRRLASVRERHSENAIAVVEAQLRKLQASRGSRMESLAQRILPNIEQLRKRLGQTGQTWSPGHFLGAVIVIAAIVGGVASIRGAPVLLSIAVGIAVGLFIPHKVVGFLIARRIKKFNDRFADAIELLVRGLRSGLPITETLSVVAKEIPGPVGVEFQGVTDRMRIGRTLDEALQETADRLQTPEFNFFCITLNIQRETGGNLAETLANLADVLRKRHQMKLKIKAMSSESKASAMIIGALPFIVFGMIWMISDNYMQKFFVDERLMIAGAGAMVWMSLGAFVMKKMISFEI